MKNKNVFEVADEMLENFLHTVDPTNKNNMSFEQKLLLGNLTQISILYAIMKVFEVQTLADDDI